MYHSIRHARRTPVMGTAVVILLVLFVPWLIATPPPARAAAYTAGTFDELSTAITAANAALGADTITLTADITLTVALPDITSEIIIQGGGYFVSGNNAVRVFKVLGAGDLTLDNLTIKNGSASDFGGGVYSEGTLTITASILSGNSAGIEAGAIYSKSSTLTLSSSTLSGNSAPSGGAIFNNQSELTITNSTLSDNHSTIAEGSGGAIYNYGTLTITASTLSGNSAYFAGGISNAGTLTITASTLSGNSATWGGAIYNGDTLTLTASTLSGNSAPTSGSIYNVGTAYLAGTLLDTGANGANCSGTAPINNGYNLSDDDSCNFSGTSQNNAVLNLAPLAYVDGGSTQTHRPELGSAAIGAIPSGTSVPNNGVTLACDNTQADQNGIVRPRVTGGACTSGAVEVGVEVSTCSTPDAIAGEEELRTCIDWANTLAGAQTLTLTANIVLTDYLPHITTVITLEGAGHSIDGAGSYQVFYVTAEGNFTINGLTIQNGTAYDGGGIRNDGTLTVTNSTFTGNSADDYGGGIRNDGTLTVTGSTFTSNSVEWNGGGGIYNLGTVTVTGSIFSGNESALGGGIHNGGGTLTVTNSTFTGNTVQLYGAGISTFSTLNVTGSTFTGNSATKWGGGISAGGATVTITNSTFTSNEAQLYAGGGIHNNTVGGDLTVTGSTFSGNSAGVSGGGISNDGGTLTITNSTFTGNTVQLYGGGIYGNGTVTITNSTLNGNMATDNHGGGIYAQGTVTMQTSIVANSPSGNNCSGTITDGGNNLSSDGTCGFSLLNTDPLLGPLEDNGGPTLTHLPLPGSPAIDAGNNTLCADPDTVNNRDQRGEVRPFDGDGDGTAVCDIGAVELPGVAVPSPLSINDASGFESSAGTITFTVTRTNPSGVSQVGYETADGTANAGSDYLAAAGILTFAEGVSSQPIMVHLRGDSQVESSERFVVTLSNPQQAVIGHGQGQGTITNSTPRLTKPANNAVTRDATPTFTWNAITGATHYQLQVDNNNDFSSPVFTVTRTVTNYTRPTALADGKYYWRVRARDAAGHLGGWSARWTFTVDTTPPARPVMVSPANNATTPDTTPLFRWRAVTGATNYTLQVDNNSNFASPVVNLTQTTTSYTPPSALAQGRYYWRVRAQDKAGNWSAWSTQWSFTVNAVPLAAPTIIPTNTPRPTRTPTVTATPTGTATITPTATITATATEAGPMMQLVESDQPMVLQAGAWTAYDEPSASGGRYLLSSTPQDRLSLAFAGSEVTLVYIQHPAVGSFAVEVDGTVMQIVDSAAAETVFGAEVTLGGLGYGPHTLTVYPVAGVVAIDAFRVETALEMVLPTPVPTDIPTDAPVETPLRTDVPTDTPTETPIPTDRPVQTETPLPTETPVPTDIPTDVPVETPLPTDVPTDVPTEAVPAPDATEEPKS